MDIVSQPIAMKMNGNQAATHAPTAPPEWPLAQCRVAEMTSIPYQLAKHRLGIQTKNICLKLIWP